MTTDMIKNDKHVAFVLKLFLMNATWSGLASKLFNDVMMETYCTRNVTDYAWWIAGHVNVLKPIKLHFLKIIVKFIEENPIFQSKNLLNIFVLKPPMISDNFVYILFAKNSIFITHPLWNFWRTTFQLFFSREILGSS